MTVTLADIEAARERLKGIILSTPMIADDRLSREIGAKASLKAESLQKAGSFKIRGAYNKISQLSEDERARGVIAASAGNHAQGVALAAQILGVKATIICPEFAPLTKINATKGYGADVILKGSILDESIAYSQELAAEHGYTMVHAFDDEKIIAGQGTIGLEILEALPGVTTIVVPIGGGGLMSGIATAVKTLKPGIRMIGVQAENSSWVKPSFEAGHAVSAQMAPTIADGIAVKKPGAVTLPILKEFVDEIVEVSDDEIAKGIFFASQNNRLVVEGGGAASLGALLARKATISPDENVCVVVSGGNIDANLLARVLEQVLVRQGRYIMLKMLVMDRPGMLAGALDAVAEARANVIEVFHRRSMWLAPLGRVGIELLLEVRDEDHAQEVIVHMREKGFPVEREGQVDWHDAL
ncbi:MAG TPA: threonine ammonia-lyase [Pyrinomonadaceae bacterium]|jgi:threonine dehydratase|nr:threonine ammonia-lyase [Pyrinomonadaceae bacterium]